MKYQLHDFDLDLWAWVKAQATLRQITINSFIQVVLLQTKNSQRSRFKRRYLDHDFSFAAPQINDSQDTNRGKEA